MMFEDKMYQIATDLCTGTASGAVKWTETADEDSFRAVLSNNIVRIERHVDPYERAGAGAVPITTGLPFQPPRGFKGYDGYIFSLVVLDNKNKDIARYVPDREERALTLRNLWEVALHSARDSERKLDSILDEISVLVKKKAK
jgi:hypothetical protein